MKRQTQKTLKFICSHNYHGSRERNKILIIQSKKYETHNCTLTVEMIENAKIIAKTKKTQLL